MIEFPFVLELFLRQEYFHKAKVDNLLFVRST